MVRQLRREDYTVRWVCTLPVELAAAQEMFGEEHLDLERDLTDNGEHLYALGSIGGYNIAIVRLSAGWVGNNLAAAGDIQGNPLRADGEGSSCGSAGERPAGSKYRAN